ncbi:acyl-CoA thioesterase [Thalassolituus sp.]|uniref:acyl-CoA thioesterase n=1 Tax=Thalassolituus sp. TaxID=2030822 RepID=UPI00261B32F8|nr:acyl-CoA thioesterase [uncultured Thalassolituus sp.]
MMMLRFLLIFFRQKWNDSRDALATTRYYFRVMPWDMDLNMHLTNTRYPAFIDVGRVQWFAEIGLLPLIISNGWRTVVASQTVTFVREIKPFTKVEIESRVLYWDRKYLYSEHRFLVEGKLHCKALGRIALVRGGRVRSFSSLLQALDKYHGRDVKEYVAPEPTPEIQAKIDLLNLKRDAELARAEKDAA